MRDEREFQQRIEQIGELTERLDKSADPDLREASQELVQRIMELHGAGLDQMMAIIRQAGEAGERIVERFSRDDLVRSLLLLYGLHPQDVLTRVRQALDKLEPSLRSHGVTAELVGVVEGVAQVKIDGILKGCGAAALRISVEGAICEAAPDLSGLVIEGIAEPVSSAFVPVGALLNGNQGNRSAGRTSSQP